MKDISSFNSNIQFLFFKLACATGWDCPRAQVLAMYRETKSPIFQTQVLGRITRTPEARLYQETELNSAYVYTNYSQDDILLKKTLTINPELFISTIKESIQRIPLKKENLQTRDYEINTNEIKECEWQTYFLEKAKEKYKDDKLNKSIITNKNKEVKAKVIVNAEIEQFDKFSEELLLKCQNVNLRLIKQEVEYMSNHVCYDFLSKHDNKSAKFSGKSYKILRNSISVWLENDVPIRENRYSILVNLLDKKDGDTKFQNFLTGTLVSYREKYHKPIQAKRFKDTDISIPPKQMSFSNNYEKQSDIKKNVYQKFYFIKKKLIGGQTESDFIDFIDKQDNVIWWHQQGDKGSQHFSIVYKRDNQNYSFYPDFIVQTKKYTYILEVKGSESSRYMDTKLKAEALQKYLQNYIEGIQNIRAGIIKQNKQNKWLLNENKEYDLNNDEGWVSLVIT